MEDDPVRRARLLEHARARRRARRGRGSPAPCRAAWPSRCARGTTSCCTPGPSGAGAEVVEAGLPDGAHPRVGGERVDLARAPRRARRPREQRRLVRVQRDAGHQRRRTAARSRPPTARPARSHPICTMRGTPTAAEAASASSTVEPVVGRVGDVEVAVLSATGTRSGSGAGGRARGPPAGVVRARVGPLTGGSRLLGLLDAREQRLALGDRRPGRQLAPAAGVLHPLRRRAARAPPRRRGTARASRVAFGITGLQQHGDGAQRLGRGVQDAVEVGGAWTRPWRAATAPAR